MQEVYGSCKICGRRMLTDRSRLERRTCDACKAIQRREYNRRVDARRKAERDAVKAKMAPPRCEQCGKPIEGANLLATRAGRNGRASSAAYTGCRLLRDGGPLTSRRRLAFAFPAKRPARASDNAERLPDDGGIAGCDRLIQIGFDPARGW